MGATRRTCRTIRAGCGGATSTRIDDLPGHALRRGHGYRIDGRARPGVSVFRHRDGKILRVADTGFQPGDDFCSVWRFFDLIPEGPAGWQPRFAYA